MLGVRVNGGTGAGSRRPTIRPDWKCACGRRHTGDRYSCSYCGARRPS